MDEEKDLSDKGEEEDEEKCGTMKNKKNKPLSKAVEREFSSLKRMTAMYTNGKK